MRGCAMPRKVPRLHDLAQSRTDYAELGDCLVCLCAGAGLATHCPGRPVSYLRQLDVCRGLKDYVNGKWINLIK